VLVGANGFASMGCIDLGSPNPIHGNLEVRANGKVAFSTASGFAQSFFASDKALGTAPLIAIAPNMMDVRYSDNFSTYADPTACSEAGGSGCTPIGSAQEEVVVLARDPIEYRTTLESIIGPSSDPENVGDGLTWAAETFAPGDVWPVVTTGDPVTVPPPGVTLPDAVRFAYPNAPTNPTTDWPITQSLLTGSSSTPFAGTAASYEGSIKGISVMQRGLCSNVQPIPLQQLTTAISPHDYFAGLGYDATVGASTFMSYAPKGGIVLTLDANVTEPQPVPIPPFFQTPEFARNVTYFFTLEDGIIAIGAPTVNASNNPGLDFYAIGGVIDGKLNHDVPDTVKLAALEGAPGTFTAGQAQPIPSGAASAPDATGNLVKCSDTTQPRPPGCFMSCDDANGTIMTRPDTWAMVGQNPYLAPEDVGDPNSIDPAKWHDRDYVKSGTSKLTTGIPVAAATYPGMTQCGPIALANVMTEPFPLGDGTVDSDKLHNLRCNFYPRYEEKTLPLPLTTTNVAKPVAEFITRAQRINVFPDSLEVVFVDGSDFDHLSPTLFGTGDSTCSNATGASEPVATFMVGWALAHGLLLGASADSTVLNSLCSRTTETSTAPTVSKFSHVLLR
jgi:hypothetical protein